MLPVELIHYIRLYLHLMSRDRDHGAGTAPHEAIYLTNAAAARQSVPAATVVVVLMLHQGRTSSAALYVFVDNNNLVARENGGSHLCGAIGGRQL